MEEKGQHSHSLKGRVPWSTLATLSKGEHTDLCLDRLLFLFWAHYIEDGPRLLCTGSLWWLPFTEDKGEGVANYIKEEGYLQM